MSLSAAVECLLFVAGEPLTIQDLARSLDCDERSAETALDDLRTELELRRSGLQVISIAGGFQLSTRPDHAQVVARLLARGANRLSRAALEALAIIAYRQPITQPEIEAIRGVSCDAVLKTLLERGLIADVGRKQTIGRPILYSTTRDFLHYFGMSDINELPAVESDSASSAQSGQGGVEERAVLDTSVTPEQTSV